MSRLTVEPIWLLPYSGNAVLTRSTSSSRDRPRTSPVRPQPTTAADRATNAGAYRPPRPARIIQTAGPSDSSGATCSSGVPRLRKAMYSGYCSSADMSTRSACVCEQFASARRDPRVTAPSALKCPRLREVRQRPADAVVEQPRAAARNHLLTLSLADVELFADDVAELGRAPLLPVLVRHQDRAHQSLEIRDRHRPRLYLAPVEDPPSGVE